MQKDSLRFILRCPWGGGGGVPAVNNSKAISDNAMKFGFLGSRESQTN